MKKKLFLIFLFCLSSFVLAEDRINASMKGKTQHADHAGHDHESSKSAKKDHKEDKDHDHEHREHGHKKAKGKKSK